MATDALTKRREALRLTAALVMALVGGAVAFMAPSAVTPGTPESAGIVWLVGAVGGVVACLLVAGSSIVRLSGRQDSVSTAAVFLGWATILGLVLGGIYGVVTGVPAGDAVGMSFIVAIPAAAAVVLTLVGRGLLHRSEQ
ncbi:hypothetical protein ACOCJ7_18365 [Knoellia sp. CPCC 206453]|uniref:hypothetical protein n=1 Tax=Knoellia pratensis TaxID=3404796 RepID=UPI00361FA375